MPLSDWSDFFEGLSNDYYQKKNPNILELIRGRTGTVYGNLISLLSVVKGLPTGYSSDLQETKPLMWDTIDIVKSSLKVLIGVIATLKVDTQRISEVLSASYAFAVDLAELLAEKTDLSFRGAHMVVGNLVREMVSRDMKPKDLKPQNIERFVEKVLGKQITVADTIIKSATDAKIVLSERKPIGSPSPKEIERMLKKSEETCMGYKATLATKVKHVNKAKINLADIVKKYSKQL